MVAKPVKMHTDRGVSETIGAVMLISVVVVAVGIVAVVLTSQGTPQNIPALDAVISNVDRTVYVYHDGGDTLYQQDLYFLVNGERREFTKNNDPDWTSWSAGESLAYNVPGTDPIQTVRIVFDNSQTATTLSSADFGESGVPDVTPTATVTTTTTPSLPPVADFAGSPVSGSAPLTVVFTDASVNSPASWTWDFGDGDNTNSTAQNPVHTFTGVGTYTVALTATNAAGSDTETKPNYISVSVPATPPTFVSAATNTAGTIITITFDKAMADPAGKHGEFTYSVNGGAGQPFSAAALNADTTKIDLTISGTAIAYGNTVTVSYTQGTVTSADTGVLASFVNRPVTNNKAAPPAVVSAETDNTGGVIIITFDKAMADPAGKHGEFTYSVNGAGGQPFSAASLNADTTKINLTTSGTAIAYGDTIMVSYTAGTVLAADTGVLASFLNQAVTNNMAAPSYTVATFSTVGTTTWTAPAGVTSVEYLVVAGGGGGGGTSSYTSAYGGGGGGAGGVLTGSGYTVVPGNTYTITVGDGGTGGATGANPGSPGGNSVFATITATGGGYGAGSTSNMAGGSGGSGGGGVRNGVGGTGTTGQGYDGGNGYRSSYLSGGGGGASAEGGDGTSSSAGAGGDGIASSISGASVTYAGGGGGGSGDVYSGAAGGAGGGGAGGAYPVNDGGDATGYGSGGGGGTCAQSGGSATAGGDGSSGIVILRYLVP